MACTQRLFLLLLLSHSPIAQAIANAIAPLVNNNVESMVCVSVWSKPGLADERMDPRQLQQCRVLVLGFVSWQGIQVDCDICVKRSELILSSVLNHRYLVLCDSPWVRHADGDVGATSVRKRGSSNKIHNQP